MSKELKKPSGLFYFETDSTMNITVITKDFIDENITLLQDEAAVTPVTDTSYPVSMNSSLLCKFSYFCLL